jgi:hypothetical protein
MTKEPTTPNDPVGPPPTPDWVKLLVLAGLVGVAIVIGLALLGGVPHGPGMHAP